MATSTIKQSAAKSGIFTVSCSAGLNIITRSTNLHSGSLPTMNFTTCIFMITSHSSVQNNNTIQVDGEDTILINADAAQFISVRWWYFPVQ